MPFLRVLRDKRGYETSYLMHWFRDGGRMRSRVLYAFRTPPGVRVGRNPLEPGVRRELEQLHPDLEFDWCSLLDTQQVVDASPDARRPRGRRRGEDGPPPARTMREVAPPAPQLDEAPVPAESGEPAVQGPPRLQIPTALEPGTPAEQTAWLAEWYARIRDDVEQRTQDPERRVALLALAEELNPESWTGAGDEAVTERLGQAAEVLQRLSRVFGRRRRRSRRARSASSPEPTTAE